MARERLLAGVARSPCAEGTFQIQPPVIALPIAVVFEGEKQRQDNEGNPEPRHGQTALVWAGVKRPPRASTGGASSRLDIQSLMGEAARVAVRETRDPSDAEFAALRPYRSSSGMKVPVGTTNARSGSSGRHRNRSPSFASTRPRGNHARSTATVPLHHGFVRMVHA